MKKKLVIATDNYLPRYDGVARFLQEVLPALSEKYAVTLLCPYHQRIPPLAHVDIITIPLSGRVVGDFSLPSFRPRIIRRALRDADIVFTQTLGPIGATSIFLARRKKIKTLAYVHSVDWELLYQALAPTLLKKYLPNFAKTLVRYFYMRVYKLLIPSERIGELFTWEEIHTARSIIHLGVDTDQFQPRKDRETIRTKLGFSPEDIVIGYHGRIAREKDLSTLVRAYVKLRKRNKHVRLLLIGNGIAALEKKFAKQDGVTLYPAVSDVENYLPAMDVYCLPSLTETTSLSVLEAMSCGLPVVATPVGFVKDYIQEGKTGLFFEKKNSFQLTKQLQKFVADPDFREDVGKHARSFVKKNFDWKVTRMKLLEEFEQL